MRRAAARFRCRDGFLLPETLATLAISAVVLAGLASTAPVLMRAVDRGVAQVQNADDLGRTIAALTRDISSLTRARWSGEEPQSFVFQGGPNSLFFARREILQDGSVRRDVIAIREIIDGSGTRLVRSDAYLPSSATSFDDLHFGSQRTLPTGAARLRFWYQPHPRGISPAQRQRAWPTGPKLPDAVFIEAVDAVTTGLILTARVPIRANADIGCLSGADKPQNPNDPGATAPGAPGSQAQQIPPPPPSGPVPGSPNPDRPQTQAQGQASTQDGFCGRDDQLKASADLSPTTGPQAGSPPTLP